MATNKTRDNIKKDLIERLEENGIMGSWYLDLIEDYLQLWDTKNLLIKDVKERGVNTEYNNGGGQVGCKKNDSVDQLLKVSQQMIKLLDAMGIKPTRKVEEVDEEM